MTKKTFTAAERQQIAAGWQTSGMSQPEYAAAHGISDRTLREWMARHAAPEAPVDAVRQVLKRTIAELERMLEELDRPRASGETKRTITDNASDGLTGIAPRTEAHRAPDAEPDGYLSAPIICVDPAMPVPHSPAAPNRAVPAGRGEFLFEF